MEEQIYFLEVLFVGVLS